MSFASVCASVRLYHMTVEEEISSKITFYKDVVNVSHPTKKKKSLWVEEHPHACIHI